MRIDLHIVQASAWSGAAELQRIEATPNRQKAFSALNTGVKSNLRDYACQGERIGMALAL
jgi:hypothetical protein